MENTINHWMIKSKAVGDTAETLWESAKEYFMWCEANPIFKKEMIKQTGAIVDMECPRPFNLPALCLHCGVTTGYITDMARNPRAGDFFFVAQRILQVIYSQNLEYAMVGIFNPVISAKKLNLGENDETGKVPAQINVEVITYAGQPSLSETEFEKT